MHEISKYPHTDLNPNKQVMCRKVEMKGWDVRRTCCEDGRWHQNVKIKMCNGCQMEKEWECERMLVRINMKQRPHPACQRALQLTTSFVLLFLNNQYTENSSKVTCLNVVPHNAIKADWGMSISCFSCKVLKPNKPTFRPERSRGFSRSPKRYFFGLS